MRILVFPLIFILLIILVLLGAGAAIGFLLHWLIPSVEVGIGMLIGVVVTIAATQLFFRLPTVPDEPELDEPEIELLPPTRLYPVIPITSRRKKRRPKK